MEEELSKAGAMMITTRSELTSKINSLESRLVEAQMEKASTSSAREQELLAQVRTARTSDCEFGGDLRVDWMCAASVLAYPVLDLARLPEGTRPVWFKRSLDFKSSAAHHRFMETSSGVNSSLIYCPCGIHPLPDNPSRVCH